MSSNSVIIVAGGAGTRMNQSLPKQFTLLLGVPVLVYTIQSFLKFDSEIQIILVLPDDHLNTWNDIHTKFLSKVKIETVIGGSTRFQSVRNGLSQVQGNLVAIHDAVRPCVAIESISGSYNSAANNGSGIVAVSLKDSIREITGEESSKSVDRDKFKLIQTPQTFQTSLIKQAFEIGEEQFFTDDASVYEYALKQEVNLVEGSYENIKITTQEDLLIATQFLKTKRP